MAIYHLSVKVVSRAAGRSATAAAAYRSGSRIVDERTGEIHDFTRKRGVMSADLVLPENAPEWAAERAKLWNSAETSEKRKNSTVAREVEVALPAELSQEQRRELALAFARELVKEHGCAADVAIHEPNSRGDKRNFHAHILLSTRRLGPDGFGEKTREWDDKKDGPELVKKWRERWADLLNEKLREYGVEQRVDHRSLADQGVTDRLPTRHLGPAATGYERRTGEPSRRRLDIEAVSQHLAELKALGEQERELSDRIIILSADISSAIAEKARAQPAPPPPRTEHEQIITLSAAPAVPQPTQAPPRPAPQVPQRPAPQGPRPAPAAPLLGEWRGSTQGSPRAGGPALFTVKHGEASIYHDHQRAAVVLEPAQTSKGPALRGTVCYPDGHSLILIIDLDDKQGGGYGVRVAVKDRDGQIIEKQAGKIEPQKREINLDRKR